MSLGACGAGIDIRVAIDSDTHAIETYAANHSATESICLPIDDIEDFSCWKPPGDFVVFGGPPCQGFSTSNQRTRTSKTRQIGCLSTLCVLSPNCSPL
ncbi:DNA cytosine methyltransferase [Sphingopyxis sp. BSNA05]|uniref:DNA cytosine methyltransferase n=1 Tax=Sphingopyxis sp. BSNA05 TaxID=1236614 RepID=UPI00349F9563